MHRENSKKLYEMAENLMPGGVNRPVDACREVEATPVFIHHGKGAKIYDEDGNEYIDFVNCWGDNILGHANEKVLQAVKEAADNGLSFGAPTRNESILAELIRDTMPVAQKVRFVTSKTEAIISALRLAKAYTRRNYILQISDGTSASLPDVLTAQYNDIGRIEDLFWNYENQIAAVFIEPVSYKNGLSCPQDGFIEYLREVTSDNGTLLIFDETITAYRLRLGGACEYYHTVPDLICLGRIIGGGFPMGMYGGKKEVMELAQPQGTVMLPDTLCVNPVTTAAGIAAIGELIRKKERYSRMLEQARQITETLEQVFPNACINRVGSLFSVAFTKEGATGQKGSLDEKKFSKFYKYMRDRGIYLPPTMSSSWFLSMAHRKEEIRKTCEAIKGFKR